MAGLWDIILPQAAVNLVTNPSFETNTTGWTFSAGSQSRVPDFTRFGGNGLQWNMGSGSSMMFTSISTMVLGLQYTASVYVYTLASYASGVSYSLYFANSSGTQQGTATTFANPTVTGWNRITVTWYNNTITGTGRLYFGKPGGGQPPIWVDGVMVETFDPLVLTNFNATTYVDGDQPGCSWAGQVHASTSSRSGQSSAGGVITTLDSLNVYVTETPGTGMPQVTNVATQLAMQDGAVFQRTLAKPRVFTLQLTAYNAAAAGSLAGLHSIRKALINATKPDRLGQAQPFVLQYRGGGDTIRISALYDAGLEWGDRKGFTESIALRCIAYDPYWVSEFDNSIAVTAVTSLASASRILLRSNTGVWSLMGTGLNGIPRCAYQSPDGTLYVGGSFTTAGGTTVNRIAKWSGGAWAAMGGTPGVSGGGAVVYDIVSDGTASGCYVIGDFTTAGGVTASNIARWSGSAWSALNNGVNTGFDLPAYSGVLYPNGLLYVGGSFTTAGGATRNRMAAWNSGSNVWTTFGTTGLAGGAGGPLAYNLAIMPSGKIAVSGFFATAGGVTAASNAAYDPTTDTYTALGTNGGGTLNNLIAPLIDGSLISGSNLFIDPLTANPAEPSYYNGTTWARVEPPTTGTAPDINAITANPETKAFWVAGGAFTTIGGQSVTRGLAYWDGVYHPLDVSIGANSFLIQPLADGSLVVGFDASVTALAAGQTTVTNNGTSAAQPRISVTGPGQLYSIVNQTTGDALYFTGLTLQTGETLVCDLRTGVKSFISNYRNCLSYVSPGSNIATFRLLPGANTIAIFCANASATAAIVWSGRYWSIDGGAP